MFCHRGDVSLVKEALAELARLGSFTPKHSIATNINEYKEFAVVNDRVDFATYNTFSSIHKGIAEMIGHCLVVIDECHHLGSDIYGKNLIKCIEHARQAVAKYRSFNGKSYKNWEELKTSDLDNKKFRTCCRMYHVVPEFDCRFLSGEGDK